MANTSMVVYNSVMIRYDWYGPIIGPFLEGEWVYRCTNTIPMESGCKCDAGADALESDLRWRHLWPEIDTCLARVEKPPRVRQRKSSTSGSTHIFLSNLPTILKNTVTQGGSYFVEDELVAHVTIQKLPSLGLEPEVVVWDFQLKYVSFFNCWNF